MSAPFMRFDARTLVTLGALTIIGLAGTPLRAQTPAASAAQAPTGPTVRLSMEQAVAMALEANLGLKRDRIDLSIASQGVAAARAAFNPTLNSGVTRNTSTSVTT